MMIGRLYLRLLLIVALLQATSGCIPAMVGAATATTGRAIAQERTVGDAMDDTTIWAKIKSDLLQQDVNNLFNLVDVRVNEGRVLMTGSVRSQDVRAKAVKIAWGVRGVKEVIDELIIATPTDELAIKDYSKDAWITTQIKSKLLLNKDIHSVNYDVQTVDGIVYLMGIAQDKTELNIVTNIASSIQYVKKVVSHVRVKDTARQQPNQIYSQ